MEKNDDIPKDMDEAVKLLFKSICQDEQIRDLYRDSKELIEEIVSPSDPTYKNTVVTGILCFLSSRGDKQLFEVQKDENDIPISYRFHKDVKVGGILKGNIVVDAREGYTKGDFVSVSEIYEWITGEKD